MKVTSSCELQGPTANRAAANLRATYSMLLCLIPFSLYSCSNFRWLFSSCRFRSAFLPLLLPLLLRLNVASAGVAQYFDNYNRMLTTGLGGYPGYFSRSDLGVGLDITLVPPPLPQTRPAQPCPLVCTLPGSLYGGMPWEAASRQATRRCAACFPSEIAAVEELCRFRRAVAFKDARRSVLYLAWQSDLLAGLSG